MRDTGECERGLRLLDRADSLLMKAQPGIDKDHQQARQIDVFSRRGALSNSLGRFDHALHHFKETINIILTRQDKPDPIDIAATMASIATFYHNLD